MDVISENRQAGRAHMGYPWFARISFLACSGILAWGVLVRQPPKNEADYRAEAAADTESVNVYLRGLDDLCNFDLGHGSNMDSIALQERWGNMLREMVDLDNPGPPFGEYGAANVRASYAIREIFIGQPRLDLKKD